MQLWNIRASRLRAASADAAISTMRRLMASALVVPEAMRASICSILLRRHQRSEDRIFQANVDAIPAPFVAEV